MVKLLFMVMAAIAVGLMLLMPTSQAAENNEVAIDRMQMNWNESSTEPVPAAVQGVRIVENADNGLLNNVAHNDWTNNYEWNDDIRRQLGSAGRRIGVSPGGQ